MNTYIDADERGERMSRYVDIEPYKKEGWHLVRERKEKNTHYVEGIDLDCIATADVQEVKHGRWEIRTTYIYDLEYGSTAYEPVYLCSCCRNVTESYVRLEEPIMPEDADFPRYCPNCGAKMDEVEQDG